MSVSGIRNRPVKKSNGIQRAKLGYDLPTAATLAKRIAQVMKTTPGVADVQISREENFPEFDVAIDRTKAALAGVYDFSSSGSCALNSWRDST